MKITILSGAGISRESGIETFRDLLLGLGVDYRYVYDYPQFNIDYDRIKDIFFEKITSHSNPIQETTTHGLDEIKSELRDELKDQIDDEIRAKLSRADNALDKNRELILTNDKLLKENKSLINKNKVLINSLEKASKLVNDEDLDNSLEKIKELKKLLENGYGFTGKAKLLDKVIEIIK